MTGKLHVSGRTGRQSVVTGAHDYDDWDRDYFCVSGFFGSYGPDLFAAAPDLYNDLENLLEACKKFGITGGNIDSAYTALAKARGENQ